MASVRDFAGECQRVNGADGAEFLPEGLGVGKEMYALASGDAVVESALWADTDLIVEY